MKRLLLVTGISLTLISACSATPPTPTVVACEPGSIVHTVTAEADAPLINSTNVTLPEGASAVLLERGDARDPYRGLNKIQYGTVVGFVEARQAPGPILAQCDKNGTLRLN